jgi:hypothetical protein
MGVASSIPVPVPVPCSWLSGGADKMKEARSLEQASSEAKRIYLDQSAEVSVTPSLRMLTIASTPREAFDFET